MFGISFFAPLRLTSCVPYLFVVAILWCFLPTSTLLVVFNAFATVLIGFHVHLHALTQVYVDLPDWPRMFDTTPTSLLRLLYSLKIMDQFLEVRFRFFLFDVIGCVCRVLIRSS